MNCEHLNFAAQVNVGRLTDENGIVSRFNADVKIICADCQTPFRFVGVPNGLSPNQPMSSPDSLELCCPIAAGGLPPQLIQRFEMFDSSVIESKEIN